jgi:hypothetical protein
MRARRPASILWFERLVLLSIAIGIAGVYLQWDEAIATVEGGGFGPGFVLVVIAGGYGLLLLLLWLIAWRASNVARWIYVVVSALGFLGLIDVASFRAQVNLIFALGLADYLLSAITLWLLFRADARNWFAGRRPVDPDIFS